MLRKEFELTGAGAPEPRYMSRRARKAWAEWRAQVVSSVKYAGGLTADTKRGPSPSIWSNINVAHIMEDPKYGMHFFDDFTMVGTEGDATGAAVKTNFGQWACYGYQGSLMADAQVEGGAVTLSSDGDNEGFMIQSTAGAFRLVTTSTLVGNGKLAFEARIKTSTVAATKHEEFVGLVLPALSSNLPRAAYPITTTDDTLDATNASLIGFHRKATAAPTDWQFCFNLAGGTVNYVTGLTTLLTTITGAAGVADTFYKLGFLFDPQTPYTRQISSATARQTNGQIARPILRVFANGQEAPTFLSTADCYNATAAQAFPTDFMAPCFAVMNQTGSTPGTSTIDWIRVAQNANS